MRTQGRLRAPLTEMGPEDVEVVKALVDRLGAQRPPSHVPPGGPTSPGLPGRSTRNKSRACCPGLGGLKGTSDFASRLNPPRRSRLLWQGTHMVVSGHRREALRGISAQDSQTPYCPLLHPPAHLLDVRERAPGAGAGSSVSCWLANWA